MREILFRGKSIYADNPSTPGYWIEGSFVRNSILFDNIKTDVLHIIKPGEYLEICLDDTNEIWPETIGQFTGLYDKNDKKIFEGDIVKTKYGRLCIVTWFTSNQECCWDLKPVDTAKNIRMRAPTRIDLYSKDNLEVKGNIHDNPELLR